MIRASYPNYKSLSENEKNNNGVTYTVEDAIEHIGFGWFQIRLLIIMGCFIMADACEMMLLSVLSQPLRCEWNLQSWQIALITTAVFTGMLMFSVFWGWIGDSYGRWPLLLIISIWTCYFGFLSAFSPTYSWILFLRSLVGVGIAGFPQSITLQAEFYSSKVRAKMIIFSQVFWSIGSVFEVLLAALIIPRLGWRWQVALSSLPLAIMLIFYHWVPESPRFYLSRNRVADAEKSLSAAAKMNGVTLPPGELVQSKVVKFTPIGGSFNLLCSNEYICTTVLLWILWCANAFAYYGIVLISTEVFEWNTNCVQRVSDAPIICSCSLMNEIDYLSLLFSTFGEFAALPINFFLLDCLGRTRSLALMMFGASVFYIFLLLCSSQIITSMLLFIIRALAAAALNAVYIYTAEIYPTMVRALALGINSGAARIGAMLTPFASQVLMKRYPSISIGIYSGVCFISAMCALLLPIETKGRELKEQ